MKFFFFKPTEELQMSEDAEIYDKNYEPVPEEKVVIQEPKYRQAIRGIVKTVYDCQKLRIAIGGRIFALYCKRNNITFGENAPSEEVEEVEDDDNETLEKKTDPKSKSKDKFIKKIQENYKRIIDGMNDELNSGLKKKGLKKNKTGKISNLYEMMNKITIKPTDLIQDLNELALVDQYVDMLSIEKKHFLLLEKLLEKIPFYNNYLSNIRGIGPALAGVLISEINIHVSKYGSSLEMYSGLDVVKSEDGTGTGRTRKKEHLVDREYKDKFGDTQIKKSITYNPFLKSKLMGVLASSFIKLKNPTYKKIYDDYKWRLQHRPDLANHTPKHIDNMAKRYMIKQFLHDLYRAWRADEGLPVYAPYAEAKLGMKPHNSPSTGEV